MFFRNETQQDALWKYSIECLKDYVDENLLNECGFHVNESEDKEGLAATNWDDAWGFENNTSTKKQGVVLKKLFFCISGPVKHELIIIFINWDKLITTANLPLRKINLLINSIIVVKLIIVNQF